MIDVVGVLLWCVYLFKHRDVNKTKFKLIFISWWFEQGLNLSSCLKVHVFSLIFVLYVLFTFLHTLLIDSFIWYFSF